MNLFQFKAITLETYQRWFEEHCQMLQNRSPFHHPAWLKVVTRGLPYEVGLIGVYTGNELVAVLPGFLSRQGPFRLFGSPLRGTMTSSLGVISLTCDFVNNGMAEFVTACSQFVKKQWGVQYTEFTLREFPDEQQRALNGLWECSHPGSYCLDLRQGQDQLWSQMKTRARRHIRKSQQMGIEIVPFDDVQIYYQMLDDTFARRGTVGWHPEHFFRVLLEELVPQDLVWTWGARYEGQIIAAGIFLHDDQEMYYLSGASLSQYRYLPTSYLLHWHAIGAAVAAGIQRYDLAGRSISSIAHFKEAFNPEAIEYVALTWAPAYVRYAKRLFLASRPYLQRFRRLIRRA